MTERFFNPLNENNPSLVTHCPVCNFRFDPIEAKIIEEGKKVHLVHITCRHCQSAIMALIIASGLGISSVGLITDLNIEDILKFKNKPAITSDDVINFHQFINKKEKILIDYFV